MPSEVADALGLRYLLEGSVRRGGGNDALIGGEGNDTLKRHFGDTIDGAASFDALLYADAGDLDFSTSKISNIEAINLEGVAQKLAHALGRAPFKG